MARSRIHFLALSRNVARFDGRHPYGKFALPRGSYDLALCDEWVAVVSRRETRAEGAARRKAIAARRERALRAVGNVGDEASPASMAVPAKQRRAHARAERETEAKKAVQTASDARLWTALLVGGAAVAVGLLGRQIVDIVQDQKRPALLQNDVYSALGSLALLAIVGVFAYRRRQLTR